MVKVITMGTKYDDNTRSLMLFSLASLLVAAVMAINDLPLSAVTFVLISIVLTVPILFRESK